MKSDKVLETKRILIFLALAFVITYVLEISIVRTIISSDNVKLNAIAQLVTGSMMFIPALCVIFTRLITKEGFSHNWIRPNFKKHFKYYLFAWFGPSILIFLGAVIYFMVFKEQFDSNMGYAMNIFEAQGISLKTAQLRSTIISQFITGILLGPILNFLTCFGEEWGWRGYLMPKMIEKFNFLPMVLITGVIWGLWHLPLTVMGHNYGTDYAGYPYLGIFAMCIFCIVMGCIFSFLSIKTGSCIPAIIAHGSLNGIASTAIYFTKDGGNNFIGPAPMGIIGGSAFVITAIIILIKMTQSEKSKITIENN